jgi:hypothetical protein
MKEGSMNLVEKFFNWFHRDQIARVKALQEVNDRMNAKMAFMDVLSEILLRCTTKEEMDAIQNVYTCAQGNQFPSNQPVEYWIAKTYELKALNIPMKKIS